MSDPLDNVMGLFVTPPSPMWPAVVSALKRKIAALRKRNIVNVGVYNMGGLGDAMRVIAFARAVKRWRPSWNVIVLHQNIGLNPDGTQMLDDLMQGSGLDGHIGFPALPHPLLVQTLYREFDVFYEAAYWVRAWHWHDDHAQAQSDRLLRPYEQLVSFWPNMNWKTCDMLETQWELMAATSGIHVTENDLHFEVRPDNGTDGTQMPVAPYITIHNGAGGGCQVKCLSFPKMAELAVKLSARADVVQLGTKYEPVLEGVYDCRGTSLNETAKWIRNAALHVDVEGGLVYVAKAVGTRSAVFFGPTPSSFFGFSGNVVLTNETCQPCWWKNSAWGLSCMRNMIGCENLNVSVQQTADVIASVLEQTAADTDGQSIPLAQTNR